MSMKVKLALGLAGLAFLAPVGAQDFEEEPEIRRYAVEVIIFRYAQDVGTGNEIFPPDEPEPLVFEDPMFVDEAAAADVLPPEPESLPESEALPEEDPLPEIEFVRLTEEELQLTEMHGRLERLQAYEPVMHFGWTQAAWSQEETLPIPLHRFDRPPADLDGHLTLYLNRYLHLVVDLQLAGPGTSFEEIADDPRLAGSIDTFGDLQAPPGPVFYRIEEDRILRNGELRYYDHPKFGLLAKVTRVEETEDDGELLGYPVQ